MKSNKRWAIWLFFVLYGCANTDGPDDISDGNSPQDAPESDDPASHPDRTTDVTTQSSDCVVVSEADVTSTPLEADDGRLFAPPVDVDGDGLDDLLLGYRGMEVLLAGKEGESFRVEPVKWECPLAEFGCVNNSNELAFGDLDGDGRRDLVAIRENAEVYLSQPPIVFTKAGELQLEGTGWGAPAIADVTGDGKADLVLVHMDTDECRDERSAQLDAAPECTSDADCSAELQCLKTEGFTRQCVRPRCSGVSIYAGAGDGTFESPQDIPIELEEDFANANVAVGDWHGDGRPEIVYARSLLGGSAQVTILAQEAGVWKAVGEAGGATTSTAVEMVDVDGDDHPDLRVGSKVHFGPASTGTSAQFGHYTHGTALSDLDGDGALDLVGLSRGAYLTTEMNADGRSFGEKQTLCVDATDVRALDLDGDGASEIVLAHGANGGIELLDPN